MEKILQNTKYFILYTLLFLFPLFFLPTTQEFFATNKLYLLAFGALLLLFISALQLLVSKKLVWEKRLLDVPLIIFVMAVGSSIALSSVNKIQAIFNPNFGLVMIVSLTVLYFYLSRNNVTMKQCSNVAMFSTALLSFITIVFFFQPFKNVNVPTYLQFLKNPFFTPLGNQLDLAIFLGFFVLVGLTQIGKRIHADKNDTQYSILNTGYFILILLAFLLSLYSLFARRSEGVGGFQTLQLPPLNISWYAAVETLKNPLTAMTGVGVDNFSAMFTRVKDIYYNQSPLWQINSFTISRSALLQIFTETGLFGLLSFGIILFFIVKPEWDNIVKKRWGDLSTIGLFAYLLICLLFLPPSLPIFFLFFLMLSQLTMNHEPLTMNKTRVASLKDLMPIYLGILIFSFLIIAVPVYFLSQTYAAEYYFKKSLDGLTNNNAKELYDNQRQAILFNPYIERYRINFSQTNLLLANNIVSNAIQSSESAQLTEQDKQMVTQAIQAAIAEAKAAVALNPQKASNWENLAIIYRNILQVTQGADAWTISAYQRAIVIDPQNPIYRLNLGGVYYSLAKYDQASLLFQQAASLKPDWPNAHYNLAWAAYQQKDYQMAASEMQNALSLVNPKTDKADFEKAQKELEEFKKMLPKEDKTATESVTPNQLSLPTPVVSISPKINLPNAASPETK